MNAISPVKTLLNSRSTGRTEIIGILNVTPDSFYDGGKYFENVDRSVSDAMAMIDAGAAWIDVGGMSTRPGSTPVQIDEEIKRVVPVIEGIISARPDTVVSIDTYRPQVAEAAINAGARVINEVSGFTMNDEMLQFAASSDLPVIVNHMHGTPETMQENPVYESLWDDLINFFNKQRDAFVSIGGSADNLVFDPGIGFGKTVGHNLEIIRNIDNLHSLGAPICLGCSRKSFLGEILNRQDPSERLPGSLAVAILAAQKEVAYLRVHDVVETADVINTLKKITKPVGNNVNS